MIRKNCLGHSLPALGFGAMRLPLINDDNALIDEAAAAKMVEVALAGGVNYFDTAWGYHEGNSERVMGALLSKYPRSSYFLASKFPGYSLANLDKIAEIFQQQLKNCRVDYFDFYMFHNVCEQNIDAYLDEKYGLLNYLRQQQKEGRIRHLGFSAHGAYDVMKRFLDAYGPYMEFCQIQINYLDWDFQKVKQKVELLNEYQMPVWAMEPLRGGNLATLSDKDSQKLHELRPHEQIPAWAFRFLQTIPEIVVTLSGMSTLQQLEENILTFSQERPLNQGELAALKEIADGIIANTSLPCTACNYCIGRCPKQLNIPFLVSLYNQYYHEEGELIDEDVLSGIPQDKQPQACISCGGCEEVCPQQLKIPQALTDFSARIKK